MGLKYIKKTTTNKTVFELIELIESQYRVNTKNCIQELSKSTIERKKKKERAKQYQFIFYIIDEIKTKLYLNLTFRTIRREIRNASPKRIT